MMGRPRRFAGLAALALLSLTTPVLRAQETGAAGIPHLQRNGQAVQLMVDGQPFLLLGGELGNSTSSSLSYMEGVWPVLQQLKLNTVLAAVAWSQVEPEEGRFDFTVVDGLVREARRRRMHLALLWFGSWKNGLSHYAPVWVKRDERRFPRARLASGTPEVLSPFSDANRDADARAFAALMRRLKEVDSEAHTVVMVQVENEVGLLGDSRDRSPAAEAAFRQPVPKELVSYLRTHRDDLLPELKRIWRPDAPAGASWEQLFGGGTGADEVFMAWAYSSYIDRVAEAGKAEYPLPMYVNAWIVQPQDRKPGDYPSGGPQAQVHDIWKAGAPAIDILAPDVYLPDFPGITALYQRSGTPLLVPESTSGAAGAANAFFAIGQRRAIGFSPFGIERVGPDAADSPIAKAYAVLGQLAPLILQGQAKGTIAGIWLTGANAADTLRLGDYTLTATVRPGRRGAEAAARGYGLVMAVGPDEYIVAGSDLQVAFAPATAGPPIAGLASVEEGTFVDGRWVPGRILNGDEVMISYDMAANAAAHRTGTGLKFMTDPSIQRVRLYRFR
jgi:hypothetical protein